ncbi:YkgJ family cysteine cluster protein [Pseudodesulfovibrio tunisiensis]|uniref:YkgJ family cysteine cluster protein n=1 Tax=Pseudodesulfovibrio tunisiensis TaxID=463192 RepID=UPI001FB51BB6|nr:zinc/iron-chelating domain-containing protein [Pseudodesulfovibrio tunisiensis]
MKVIQTGDPDVCARCAGQGPTCCRISPGNEEHCFPISPREKERIREAVPFTGGFVPEPNSAAFRNNLCNLFPGEGRVLAELFPDDDEHYRLALDSTGACRFLGPAGCEIPVEVRPYFCRIFPFWVVGDTVTFFDSPFCLARREGRNLGPMLDLFGLTRARVRDLYGRLRLVWGLPPAKGMRKVTKTF